MEKKVYGKSDWQEFRKEILELVILYHHVKEYSEFDKDKIEYIKSFFHLSKKQAITSFFIKVGFLVTEGTTTLRNFLRKEDYDVLMKIYISKVGLVRDKLYAHNARTDKKMKGFSLKNEDVDFVYNQIISLSTEVDKKFDEDYYYNDINGSEGVSSIEYLMDSFQEFQQFKRKLRELGFQAKVKLDVSTGNVEIID
jgi:hypothetical protein